MLTCSAASLGDNGELDCTGGLSELRAAGVESILLTGLRSKDT